MNKDIGPKHLEVSIRAVLGIAAQWSVSDEQLAQLLAADTAEVARWRRDGPRFQSYSDEALQTMVTCLSYLLGIYKALHTLFSDPEQANGWIQRPHNRGQLAGKSALQYMLDEGVDGLAYVRRNLDSVVHS